MRNISDLNDLCNFQDVAILLEITESRFEIMHKKYDNNPRLCSSVKTLNGCIERHKSKVILALLTNTEIVKLLENLLSDGFSCIKAQ